ncbi:MAG: ThuA domain-containing protein [Planctomycetota bacterium]
MVRRIAVVMSLCLVLGAVSAADAPIKALLICGGCCHDYAAQKDILKKGIEARANVVVDIIYSENKSTKPPLPIYGNPEYAKGYDVVIHDECSADINDPAVITGVLKPHREDGIPAVNLHCAMHCYRFGDFKKPVPAGAPNAQWYDYMGLQTTGHGPQEPIAITYTDKESEIVKGLEDWITLKEELYNNIQITTGKALASGKQTMSKKDKEGKVTSSETTTVVVWTNEYTDKKTRVFSTTIGHNNATVSDPRYIELVTRGLLWACKKPFDAYLKPKTDTK